MSVVPSVVPSAVPSAVSVDWSQAWVARRDAVAAEGGGCGVVPPEAGELGQLVRAAHLWGSEGVGVVLSTCMRARARSAGTDSPLSRAIKCNQVQSSAIKCNQVQSSAITSCHEPIGFRQPNRCLMTIKADSSRSALASLGEVKTGFEKENHASIFARSTSSSSGMASQSGVFCRRAGRPKLRRGVPN